MTIPSPIDVVALAALAALDEATHDQRIAWIRGLSRKELSALYDLAEGGRPWISRTSTLSPTRS